MSLSSVLSTQWGARCGASLLLAIPFIAHAQFAVVAQHAQVHSAALDVSDNKTSDEINSVSLSSRSVGVIPACVYDPYGNASPSGCGSYPGSVEGLSSYSSTITPNAIGIVASGGGSGFNGNGSGSGSGSGRITLDVLSDTTARYDGSFNVPGTTLSFARIVDHPDGTHTTEAVPLPFGSRPTQAQGLVSLVTGRYELSASAAGGSNFSSRINFSISAVPESATWGLMGIGLAGVTLVARRRQRMG